MSQTVRKNLNFYEYSLTYDFHSTPSMYNCIFIERKGKGQGIMRVRDHILRQGTMRGRDHVLRQGSHTSQRPCSQTREPHESETMFSDMETAS